MKHLRLFESADYGRVIPRDLFNEAKLLKCMGQLCLRIHNNDNLPAKMSADHDGSPFKIDLMDEGSLTICEAPTP